MKCKSCKREIDDAFIFCPWCGNKQVKERNEISVPAPRKLKSGSYSAQLMVDGKRVSITAPSEKEYYAKARAAKTGLMEIKKSPRMTVGEMIDKYINANSNVLSPSTIRGYKSVRESRFRSVIGKDVNSGINWQTVINEESKLTSAKTLSNAWRVVTASMKANDIDVPSVNLPKVPKAEREWLDYKQIKDFLKAIEGKPCELGALLGLHSLRRSEIYALTSDKIDLVNGTILVKGAVVLDSNNKPVAKQTNKNATSTRTVPIVIPRLRQLLEGADGQIVQGNINTLYNQIKAVAESAGLPSVGIHSLRHSFASLAYHLGWSEATTMQVGGWSNTDTVHKIYTHLSEQDKNNDIKRMENYYKTKST